MYWFVDFTECVDKLFSRFYQCLTSNKPLRRMPSLRNLYVIVVIERGPAHIATHIVVVKSVYRR